MKIIFIWAALVIFPSTLPAQKVPPPLPSACDSGIVRMSNGVNGSLTVCSAIAAETPALVRQVAALGNTVKNQSDAIAELERLVRAANTLGRNLSQERQTKLLESILARLDAATGLNETHLGSHITSLADEMDNTQNQLIRALSNPATAAKTAVALQGDVGDSISRLDFTGVSNELDTISRQLTEMNGKIDKIDRTTAEINSAVQSDRTSPAKIRAALEVADINLLNVLLSSGVSPSVVQGELRARAATDNAGVARLFFEASIHSAEALKWLQAELDRGLDPNMSVVGDFSTPEGILLQALRAGNADAVKLLLRNGASPHAFQDIGVSSYPSTMFLSPIAAVADSQHFTSEEKQHIVAAMLAAGAVVPEPHKTGSGYGPQTQMERAQQLQTTVASHLGVSLPISHSLCEKTKNSICEQATRRTGEDWCARIAAMPKAIRSLSNENDRPPFGDVDLKYLLLIKDDNAFFLGLDGHQEGYQEYVLVKVSKDASSWTVTKFVSEDHGRGWVSLLLQQKVGTNDLDVAGRELSWRISRHGCDSEGLQAPMLPTDAPGVAWSAQSAHLSPTRAGKAGPSTETLQNGSLLARSWRRSMLMIRDNPGILDQPKVLEEMTKWILWGEPNAEFERYANDPLEQAGVNKAHPMFVYDWSELLKKDPVFAKGAALDVYLRPDLDWEFLQHTPGWDSTRPRAWVGMFLFPREADTSGRDDQKTVHEVLPILKEQLLLAAKRESAELWFPVDISEAHYDNASKKIVFASTELLERTRAKNLAPAAGASVTYLCKFASSGAAQTLPGGYRTSFGELERWRELTGLRESVDSLAFDRKLLLPPVGLDQDKAEAAIHQGLQARVFFVSDRVQPTADEKPQYVMIAHVKFVEIRTAQSHELVATVPAAALPVP